MIDFDAHNQDVKEWANRMKQTMQATGTGMGIRHRSHSPSPSPSLALLKTGFKYDTGAIEVVSFKFPRALIWTHKGAGKGRGGNTGSTWIDRYDNRKKTNPASMGKMGTGGRTAKPWLTKSLDMPGGVEQLADLVATNLGATISNNILKENR